LNGGLENNKAYIVLTVKL